MKRKLLACSLVFLTLIKISAQRSELRFIDKHDMRTHMAFMASDELQGRETGTNGNSIAALYIRSQIERMGLKAPYADGNYLQDIPFTSTSVKASLVIPGVNGTVPYSTDSLVTLTSERTNKEISGEVAFIGYGYENKNTGYSDLKDMNVTGKIVLVMTRKPEMADAPGDEDYVFSETAEQVKFMPVLMQGPKAVLFVYDPQNNYNDAYESGLAGMIGGQKSVSLKQENSSQPPVNIFFISKKTADRLLAPTGFTLKQCQEKISADRKPVSRIISGTDVTIKLAVESDDFTAWNVVGMIEGSDPVLKNECVLYSAHFDHEGINEDGQVMNGADDDASGTVGLMEVAEAFVHLRKKPLRTIIFAWVNAEEKGLLGSRYYAGHPVIPVGKTIVNINLDMIGRSLTPADTGRFMNFKLNVTRPGEIQMFSSEGIDEMKKIAAKSSAETGVTILDLGRELPFGSSDHASFAAKGVPFLLFHSGIHSDLHSPRDDAGSIDYDKMEKVSRMVFLTGYRIANMKKQNP